jgi:hypothetical protein
VKLLRLFRNEDVSGCSGVGLVAEMCVFSSGRCAVSFLPGKAGVSSVQVYDSVEDAIQLHGHNGLTEFKPVTLREYADSTRDEWDVFENTSGETLQMPKRERRERPIFGRGWAA